MWKLHYTIQEWHSILTGNIFMTKKTILIDLDGVLNTYTGKYDKNYIEPIADGAFKLIQNLP